MRPYVAFNQPMLGDPPWPIPALQIGPLTLPVFCDMPKGGRLTVAPTGQGVAQAGPPLPMGCMVFVIPVEVASQFRAIIEKAKTETPAAADGQIRIELAGLVIYLCADLTVGGDVTAVQLDTGIPIPTNVRTLPAGSMLAAAPPELAAQLRPHLLTVQRELKQLLNGDVRS